MKPAVEWVSRPSRPSEDLPSSRAATSSGRVTTSYVDPEHELARVQDERLLAVGLHHPGEVGLVLGRVDVRVPVVLEDTEEAVEPDVDARGLHHVRFEGLEADPLGVDLGEDVAVGEKHTRTLPTPCRRGARFRRRRTLCRIGRMPDLIDQLTDRRRGFHRYVALGDSFTEGVGDPDPTRPNGLRGWADRVAEVLADRSDDFGYANLAIRGRKLPQVLAEQLEPALALRPDLVTIYAGGNDILRPKVDIDGLIAQYDHAVGRLVAAGAHVVMFTGFDLGFAPVFQAPARPGRGLQRAGPRGRRRPRRDGGGLLAHARAPRPALLGHRPDAPVHRRPRADGPGRARRPRRPAAARRRPRAHAAPGPAGPARRERGLGSRAPRTLGAATAAGTSSGDGVTPKHPGMVRLGDPADAVAHR